MGYIKHNAIVVTGWDTKQIEAARLKAIEIFEQCFSDEPISKPYGSKLVSEIVHGVTNGQLSFFIAPDGSKEGWGTSDNGDEARKQFCDWMQNKDDNYCDYIEIRFGGDDESETFVRSKDTDIDKLDTL